LEAEAEVLYIVNLLPCTITRVAAMKQTNFGPKLMTVPADWYTIYETDYDGYTVTEIGMTKPLSQRTEIITNPDGTKRRVDSKWSDDLYVTLTSSVGPNPADIIQWLVEKYTDLTVDSASFAHVKGRLTNYPAAFALTARKNVMELVADIATQSRCVVYVRNDVVYLKYASEEPTSAATITASDVLANTLKVTLSSNEELATKHTITWSRSQSEGELKLILKQSRSFFSPRAIRTPRTSTTWWKAASARRPTTRSWMKRTRWPRTSSTNRGRWFIFRVCHSKGRYRNHNTRGLQSGAGARATEPLRVKVRLWEFAGDWMMSSENSPRQQEARDSVRSNWDTFLRNVLPAALAEAQHRASADAVIAEIWPELRPEQIEALDCADTDFLVRISGMPDGFRQ